MFGIFFGQLHGLHIETKKCATFAGNAFLIRNLRMFIIKKNYEKLFFNITIKNLIFVILNQS